MIVMCEGCETNFNVEDRLVKPSGSRVRCSKCRHVFTVYPPAVDLDAEEPLTLEDELPAAGAHETDAQLEEINSTLDALFNEDPATEAIPLLGSSEGLFVIHLCLLDPGETALVPDPSYPSYAAGVKIAGGQVEAVPLLRKNGFLPDLASIPSDLAQRAKMIWVNYPNNPTGAHATLGFYQKLVDWARKYWDDIQAQPLDYVHKP